MTRLSDRALLSMIDKIYAAAVTPDRWRDVLESLSALYDAHFAILFGLNVRKQRVAFAHVAGIPAEVLAAYDRDYVGIDLRITGARQRPVGTVSTERTLFAPGEIERSRIYNEFVLPLDVPRILDAIPQNTPRTLVTLRLNRSAHHGPFNADERRFVEGLMPHLQRAALISTKLCEREQLASLALAALDRATFGVVIVNDDGQILETNSVARALLDSRDGIFVRARRMELADATSRSAFRRLLNSALASAADFATGIPVLVTVPRGAGRAALQLSVIAIPRNLDWSADDHARAFVMIYDIDRPLPTLAETVRTIYHLSAAESRVAERLAAGQRLEQVCEQLHISLNTARTHLKRIYQKTDVQSQSQLMRKLLLGPAARGSAASSRRAGARIGD